jgi:hypothetical protein
MSSYLKPGLWGTMIASATLSFAFDYGRRFDQSATGQTDLNTTSRVFNIISLTSALIIAAVDSLKKDSGADDTTKPQGGDTPLLNRSPQAPAKRAGDDTERQAAPPPAPQPYALSDAAHKILMRLVPYLITSAAGYFITRAYFPRYNTPQGQASAFLSIIGAGLGLLAFIHQRYSPLYSLTDNGIQGAAIGLANTVVSADGKYHLTPWRLLLGTTAGAIAGLFGGIMIRNYIGPLAENRQNPKKDEHKYTFGHYAAKLFALISLRAMAMEAIRTLLYDEYLNNLSNHPEIFAQKLGVNVMVGFGCMVLFGPAIHLIVKHEKDKRIWPEALSNFYFGIVANIGFQILLPVLERYLDYQFDLITPSSP